jgi:hypothetical protein
MRALSRRKAAVTHIIRWSHYYFFPAVVIELQCLSIRDGTVCRHPLRLGGQQWRRNVRRKQRQRRRSRRRPSGRRSSLRRDRSSASHVSKIASHGPADVEGGSSSAHGAPAQVIDGGRRRDGESGSRSSGIRRVVKKRSGQSGPWTGGTPADLMLKPLADALGLPGRVDPSGIARDRGDRDRAVVAHFFGRLRQRRGAIRRRFLLSQASNGNPPMA